MITQRAIAILAIALPAAFAAVPGRAQDVPPQAPQLRIDPGMHTAPVRRIGVDGACTLLVTGSDDKTVRLWRLPDGKLLNTLRPPVGPGDDGKIYAVAVAPDASWIAAGGWNRGGGDHWVFIFETSTGQVLTRLGKLANVINHLAVSRDGRYLAATLAGGEGMRVWHRVGTDPRSWRLVGEDKNYDGKGALAGAFDRAGALYTGADDGKLRRYAPGYTGKPLMIGGKNGKEPASMAAHPTEDRMAVGYDDTTAVDIYTGSTLTWRSAAQAPENVNNGDLGSVAWSSDGRRLYAGGRFTKGGLSPIYVWDRVGSGAPRELQGAKDTIMHVIPCGDSIAYGTSDPAFGMLAPDGSRVLWQENVQADMRGKRFEHFPISNNGLRVRFGLQGSSSEPVLFDVGNQQLVDSPRTPDDLNVGDTSSLPITDWINRRFPKLAGKPLEMQAYETASSLVIASDKQYFILGSDWGMRRFDKDGKLKWRRPVPATVWGVNISRDGRLVLAAHGDGTIRWYRPDDGRELLALFVHAKDRRWVLWTPKGYYAASAGGDNLIGWAVNRGWTQTADFFPAARFRDQFYRPDIVKLALSTLDEDKAIEQANSLAQRKREDEEVRKRLPPVINILSPHNEEDVRGDTITVEYTVRSPSQLKISGVRAFIDDRPAGEGQKGLVPVSLNDSKLTLKVPVPPKDATLSLVAFTEAGIASEPARVRLRWTGAKVREQLPTLYALVIGVARYGNASLDLKYADKDANDFAAELSRQEGKAYAKVVVNALTNDKATSRNILLGLEWLKDNVKSRNDRAVLFFSGHGVTTQQLVSYLLPQDVEPTKLIATGLNKRVILDVLRGLPGKVLVFLDACHSAGGLESAGMVGAKRLDTVGLVNEFADAQNGIVSFVSSKGDELSYEDEHWKNGAFTNALVEGLAGKALGVGEKEILTIDLYRWLFKRVQALTNNRQTPIMHSPPNLEPFAVALSRG